MALARTATMSSWKAGETMTGQSGFAFWVNDLSDMVAMPNPRI